MRRLIAIGLALIALGGCKPTEEEDRRVRAALPPGCQLHYLGEYGSVRNLVIVTCDGRHTTTALWLEQHGKSSNVAGSMMIGR